MDSKERLGDTDEAPDNHLDPIDAMFNDLREKGEDVIHADDNMSLGEYQLLVRQGWAETHINQEKHEITVRLTDSGKKEAERRKAKESVPPDAIYKFPLPMYDMLTRYGEKTVREIYTAYELSASDWGRMSNSEKKQAVSSVGFPSISLGSWSDLPSEAQRALANKGKEELIHKQVGDAPAGYGLSKKR